jgi:hypothetical protein
MFSLLIAALANSCQARFLEYAWIARGMKGRDMEHINVLPMGCCSGLGRKLSENCVAWIIS